MSVLEKITFNNRGQWQLSKARGTPTYKHTMRTDHPIPHEDRQSHVSSVMNHIEENGHQTKMIDGHKHILLHRGVSGHGDNSPLNESAHGPNLINTSDGQHVVTSHNSVHTSDSSKADGYAMEPESSIGKRFSFWVPTNKIIGHEPSLDAGHKEDNLPEADHILVSPGKYKIHEVHHFKNPNYNDKHEYEHSGDNTYGMKSFKPHKIETPNS